ncbi:MAG: Holliday junction branch migration protein RuvA [Myxococcota bacterium]
MIGRIEGALLEKSPTRVLIDARGVGYELSVPLSTFAELPDTGKTVALHVYTHLRADALLLYGFGTRGERDAFHLLLRANRVGPRLAQTILSGISPRALVDALCRGEARVLRAVPGIGAKMAERMIVELRDTAKELAATLGIEATGGGASPTEPVEEAISALVHLGYPRSQAEKTLAAAARECGEDASLEELIRAALRSLGS